MAHGEARSPGAAGLRRLGLAAAGAALFALPFLSMGVGTRHHGGTPHSDHAPRYGGVLLMVGDHHLEVVDTEASVDVYVSDSKRTPIRPASGRVRMKGAAVVELVWESDRLVGRGLPKSAWADYEVVLEDGTLLAIRVPRR